MKDTSPQPQSLPYIHTVGRKCKRLVPERRDKLMKALSVGNTIRNACQLAGLSDKSFYRWMRDAKENPGDHELQEFQDTVKRAKAEAENRMILVVQRAALEDWRAAAWYLERTRAQWGRNGIVKETR